jgi:hypothetical protein
LLRREDGQTLILVVLALPTVLLAMTALVVDGSKLFVERRSGQNAADSIALAIAQKELDPYGGGCLPAGSCLTIAQTYSDYNDFKGTSTLHACNPALPTDTNCYQTPYKGRATSVQVRLTKNVSTIFGKVVKLASVNVSTSAAASVKPCAQDPASGCYPLFAYAMSTQCDAIQIHGPNNDPTGGGNTFPGLWTNGGISATSPNNTAHSLLFGNSPPCSLPSPGDLSGPTANPPPAQRPCTPTACVWPTPLPDLTSLRATCASQGHDSNTNLTVGANWTTGNLPGVYCVAAGKDITINGNNLSLIGYTFVGDNITLNNSLDGSDFFGCAGGAPRCTVFYATTGDVHMNSVPGAWQGDIYAPGAFDRRGILSGGNVTYSGGTAAIFDGLIEAQKIIINAKSTIFTGSGATVGSAPIVSLDE